MDTAPAAAFLAGLLLLGVDTTYGLVGLNVVAPAHCNYPCSVASHSVLRFADPLTLAGQELDRALQCIAVFSWTLAELGVVLPVAAASLTAPTAPQAHLVGLGMLSGVVNKVRESRGLEELEGGCRLEGESNLVKCDGSSSGKPGPCGGSDQRKKLKEEKGWLNSRRRPRWRTRSAAR